MTPTWSRSEWIDRFVVRVTKLMPGLSFEQATAVARDAFEGDGSKRAPEVVADLHAISAVADPSWLARFAAELMRSIPALTGLDAVRSAKQEYERRQHLDPAEAARAYAKRLSRGPSAE